MTCLLAAACALSFPSCARTSKGGPHKRLPSDVRREPGPSPQAPAPPIETPRTNAKPSTADVAGPRRQASMRLVESGRSLAASGDFDRAAVAFRDAINVDASNGIAYYELAAANAELGLTQVALGLLDKAEALIGADAEWMERIDDLRSTLGAPQPKPIVQSPIDQAF